LELGPIVVVVLRHLRIVDRWSLQPGDLFVAVLEGKVKPKLVLNDRPTEPDDIIVGVACGDRIAIERLVVLVGLGALWGAATQGGTGEKDGGAAMPIIGALLGNGVDHPAQ